MLFHQRRAQSCRSRRMCDANLLHEVQHAQARSGGRKPGHRVSRQPAARQPQVSQAAMGQHGRLWQSPAHVEAHSQSRIAARTPERQLSTKTACHSVDKIDDGSNPVRLPGRAALMCFMCTCFSKPLLPCQTALHREQTVSSKVHHAGAEGCATYCSGGASPVKADGLGRSLCTTTHVSTQVSTLFHRLVTVLLSAAATTCGRSPAAAPGTQRQCHNLASCAASPAQGSSRLSQMQPCAGVTGSWQRCCSFGSCVVVAWEHASSHTRQFGNATKHCGSEQTHMCIVRGISFCINFKPPCVDGHASFRLFPLASWQHSCT